MADREEPPEHPAFPDRLRTAIQITLPLLVTPAEAVDRLRRAVETGARVDVGSATTDRRLTGEISSDAVRLSANDADWAHRRKGWKVQLVGQFETAPIPALRVTTDIANHRSIRRRVWVLRVAALVPLMFGIASAFALGNGSSPPVFAAVFGIAIGLIGLAGATWVERSIEAAAADDVKVLTDYVRSLLE